MSDESYVTSSFDGTVKVWNCDDYTLEYTTPALGTAYNDVVEVAHAE
jgi:WD40 repeat protein